MIDFVATREEIPDGIWTKYQPLIDLHIEAGRPDLAEIVEAELRGVRCPICGMAFERHDIDGWGTPLWRPRCRCFPQCAICKRFLWREALTGQPGCMGCGPMRCMVPAEREQTMTDKFGRSYTHKAAGHCWGVMLPFADKRSPGFRCETCGNTVTPYYRGADSKLTMRAMGPRKEGGKW